MMYSLLEVNAVGDMHAETLPVQRAGLHHHEF